MLSVLEQAASDQKPSADTEVLAGVKMRNMVEDKADFKELMQLENENFALD